MRVSLLGKKGDLSVILKTMGKLTATDINCRLEGKFNKDNLQNLITERKNQLNSEALEQRTKMKKLM